MVGILAEKIHDNRFLRLIRQHAESRVPGRLGMERDAFSGVPQGGVVSPVLSNIYLDRLDKFAETVLIPEYTRGVTRAANPEYARLTRAISDAGGAGDRASSPAAARTAAPLPRAETRVIPATGGCDISGTPTITSSGSPDRKPKPSRSSSAWQRSCVMTSSWNSTRTRR